jgi:hypothetical protein
MMPECSTCGNNQKLSCTSKGLRVGDINWDALSSLHLLIVNSNNKQCRFRYLPFDVLE